MKNVILAVDQTRLSEKVSQITRGCHYLQEIYDGLKDLGAETITVDEIKSLMISDGNIADIKGIILKDKVLHVAGMRIANESIHFDKQALADLSRVCRNAPNSLEQGDFYEIVEGRVKVSDSLEDDLRPAYTLLGSEKQKEIVDKVEVLCDQINALRAEMGAEHPYHPLRSPDNWYKWDTSGKFVPDVYRISQNVNP